MRRLDPDDAPGPEDAPGRDGARPPGPVPVDRGAGANSAEESHEPLVRSAAEPRKKRRVIAFEDRVVARRRANANAAPAPGFESILGQDQGRSK